MNVFAGCIIFLKEHVFTVIFILYVRLQGISESTVVILYLNCKKVYIYY